MSSDEKLGKSVIPATGGEPVEAPLAPAAPMLSEADIRTRFDILVWLRGQGYDPLHDVDVTRERLETIWEVVSTQRHPTPPMV